MNDATIREQFSLLVAAAGQGSRLGRGPKAFLRLGERSLLQWVVATGAPCVSRVLVAVPPDSVERAREELALYPDVQVLAGGVTRQASYTILAQQCHSPGVIIRDVARPLASTLLLRRVAEAALAHGAAGVFTPLATPIALQRDGIVYDSVARQQVLAPANPQAYRTDLLRDALHRAQVEGVEAQTLWELFLRGGDRLFVVDSDEDNPKITSPRDWELVNTVIFPRWLQQYQQGE